MLVHVRSVVFVVAVFLLCVPVPCEGQSLSESDSAQAIAEVDTARRLQEGVRLVEAGKHERAIRLLTPLLREAPGYANRDGKGPVAYWVGRAYEEMGQPQNALGAFRTGTSMSTPQRGGVDVRLADAFVQRAVEYGTADDHERAAQLYFGILRHAASDSLSDEEKAVVRRHLREVAVLIPETISERAGMSLNPTNLDIDIDLKPGAGATLIEWWRSQDPLPATRQNERVHEHLRRVVHARTHLSHEGQMDDRGKVYIRLGEPRRDVSIGMEHEETRSAIATPLRRNEFWTYHHIHEKAYYLFVETQPERFQLEGMDELFPPDMRMGVEGGRGRSREKALKYLYEMEEALRELATFQTDYATRATDVFERAAWARDNEQFGIGSDPVDGPAGSFLRSMESRIESIERQNALKRARNVPRSYTAVSKNVPDLPIAARTARFLTPSGDTRVEVYWSVPSSALVLTDNLRDKMRSSFRSSPRFVLWATAVQEGTDHLEERVLNKRYRVGASSRTNAILPPRTFSTTTSDSLFHLALQWDQYAARERTQSGLQLSRVLRRHTEHYDTLRALNSDPETLEMSDLKLLTVTTEQPTSAVMSDEAVPYPFNRVGTDSPLALSFEVYHLARNDQGRTRYTVSYEVHRHKESGGGVLGLFEADEEKTATTTTYRGRNRRTEEYILLDLNLDNTDDDGFGEVEITVRVTDEVTGQQVRRSISLGTITPNSN